MCYARRSIVDGLTVPSNKLSQRYAAWGLFHRVFGYSLQKSALPIFLHIKFSCIYQGIMTTYHGLKRLLWEDLKYDFSITHIILMTLLYRQAASHHRLHAARLSQIVWQSFSLLTKTKLTCGYMT